MSWIYMKEQKFQSHTEEDYIWNLAMVHISYVVLGKLFYYC